MIAIIGSGIDTLQIVKLCQQNNLSFCIIADTEYRPYQDKTIEKVKERSALCIEKSKEIGCRHIILTPTQELLSTYDNMDSRGQKILPLFGEYLYYSLSQSIIGKIGFIGGHNDIISIEKLFSKISNSYNLTAQQLNTKKFHSPLCKWTKDTSMREYITRLFSPRNMMINNIIKKDLKYFKDANVDTIIPLNYSYFNYQKTITNYFNIKRQKFHKRTTIENIFKEKIVKEIDQEALDDKIIIYHTGSTHFFQSQKKREWQISQGKKYTIEYRNIIL